MPDNTALYCKLSVRTPAVTRSAKYGIRLQRICLIYLVLPCIDNSETHSVLIHSPSVSCMSLRVSAEPLCSVLFLWMLPALTSIDSSSAGDGEGDCCCFYSSTRRASGAVRSSFGDSFSASTGSCLLSLSLLPRLPRCPVSPPSSQFAGPRLLRFSRQFPGLSSSTPSVSRWPPLFSCSHPRQQCLLPS